MPERTMVTAAEVARLAGVGRAAVSNWRRRHADFPRPTGGTETSPTFRLSDIQRWLQEQGKLTAVGGLDLVWHELDGLPGDTATALAAAGAHLAGTPGVPLPGPLRVALDDLAADLGAEQAFERLLQRFVEAFSRQLAVTEPELAALMIELTATPSGLVVDPACGTASLLRAAPAGAEVRGQEIDDGLAALARSRLAFRTGAATVQTGDSLRATTIPFGAADAVVCNPPFNVRHWGFEELQYDERWVYGLPPRTESELAWVQHCLALLRPDCRAVVLMPPGVASRRAGRAIRAELLRRGTLRAVVALPNGSAAPASLSMHLWVLERPGDRALPDGLVLVDTTGGTPARIDELGWPVVVDRVRQALRGDRADGASWRTVPVIELLDDDVDLNPARHLRRGVDLAGLDADRRRLGALVDELSALVPGDVVPASTRPAQAMVSIGELARSGALLLRQQIGRWETVPDGPGLPVLTGRDVATGQVPSARLPAGMPEPLDAVRLEVGDVVVPQVASRPVAMVVDGPGALLGPHVHLLRPDPEQLDPWFLAGFLRSSATLRNASSLSGTYRPDVRRTEVPRIPLEQQRRYGAVFRRLATFQRLTEQSAALGRQVTQALLDGVAEGVIEPDATLHERPTTRTVEADMEDRG